MLEEELKSYVYCTVHGSIGSVRKLPGVQQLVCDGFKVEQHKALNGLNTEVRVTGLQFFSVEGEAESGPAAL